MIASGVRTWAHARTLPEWLALGAATAVSAYLGWDSALWDARLQLVLHLLAVAAIAGIGMLAVRGVAMPRTSLDTPILALLAAFALATASAMNHGMSLRAMASIMAFALALPLALLAIRHRPSWVGVIASVPVLLLAAPTLLVMLSRRLDWIAAGAPGLPPLRLAGEGTPFGSVAVPPFVIWPAWALAGLIESPRWRGAVRIGLVVVGIPLTVLSGSRSAWLAIAAAAAVGGIPWAWSHRQRLQDGLRRAAPARTVLLGLAAIAVAGVLAALIIPRLAAVTSLVYRVALWRDTVSAWQTDPLLGIGPGFMPYARQAAAADFTFPVRQPHSHNLPLGVLGDAGIVGLAVALLVVGMAAWMSGPWRARSARGRTAGLVLIGLGVGGLFEDLTFLPNFNLLAITLLAMALTDAGAVRWIPPPSLRAPRGRLAIAGTGVIGAVLLGAMVTSDAGALTYRRALDAAASGGWQEASAWLGRSEAIDPWHPAPPRALAVTAAAAGEPVRARDAAERAVERNPGDGEAWANLALLCAELEDRTCQLAALERTVATSPFASPALANAALAYEALGLAEHADDAFARSLLAARPTALALEWPRDVPVGQLELEEDLGPLVEGNRVLAQWAMGETIDPAAIVDPAARALAHAIRDERASAEEWLRRAVRDAPEVPFTWDLVIVLRDHWGESIDAELRVAEAVRGGSFPPRRRTDGASGVTYDIASFRGVPLDGLLPRAERLDTDPPFPWGLSAVLP